MPRIIEPLDSSAVWDAIENPPIATISAAQWDLIEHLAAQAGEAGRATGDLYRWGLAAHDRLVALAEMPGAGILSLLSHLLMLRREDLIDSILSADYDGEIVHELMLKSAEIETKREKIASQYRPATEDQLCEQSQGAEWARKRREQRWQYAQDNAGETLAKIAEIIQADPRKCRDTLEKIAGLLGIRCYGRSECGHRTTLQKEELRELVDDRIAALEGLASPAQEPLAVVITTGEPAPGPQDASVVVAVAPQQAEPAPGAAGPPPLTAETLISEAWDREVMRSTTRRSLDSWEALVGRGEAPDWRRSCGMLSDHWGPSAAAMISGVCSVPFAEVVAYGSLVRERHQECLAELRAAYSDAQGLLSDAMAAPGWEWLAEGLGVGPEALWQRCRELTADPRPSAL